MQKPTHDYVATAKCGCVVGLIAVIPGDEKETAKDVASFIKSGCLVELVERSSKKFRDACANFGHHCQPEQPALFTPSNIA
jgi:hypothetical protein